MKLELDRLVGFVAGFDIYTEHGVISVTNYGMKCTVRYCPNIRRLCVYFGWFYIQFSF